MKSHLLSMAVLLAGLPAAQAEEPKGEKLKAPREAVEAWRDMRFGMFICWGPVTLTGKEIGWSRQPPPYGKERGFRCSIKPRDDTTPTEEYDSLYKKWKPERFDARQWVQIAKEAGARYLVFLVKHHDGFCLFDSKLTDYKTTGPESSWKVDVLKEIADACHAADMKLIVYYSQPDWHHPDFCGPHHERYIEYLHGQIREILTNYGRIDGLWFDGLGSKADRWDPVRLFSTARSIQPNLLINNRCGIPGDFSTPEQHIGRYNPSPWESCFTLGTQWAWKPDDTLKPYTDAIRMLVACAVGDGNLALNTNPMPDGRIEPRQVESFRKLGQWLAKYGQSIYGTRGGPFVAPDPGKPLSRDRTRLWLPEEGWWGGSTHKGNVVYLHILRWPEETIVLQPIKRRIVKHAVLTGGEATLKETERGIEISLPAAQRDPIDTIIKLELDAPVEGISAKSPIASLRSLTTGKKATASNWFRKLDKHAADKAVDGDPDTRWGCDWKTYACWLEVDLGQPATFSRATISEPYDRVQQFELQVWDGGEWKTFHRGTTIGPQCEIRFPAVTGQRVRLNLPKASDGPSIWEFHLFSGVKP